MAGRDAPLNPDSIEAPGFRTSALGYRKEEVDAFLRQLADAVRRLGGDVGAARIAGDEPVPPAWILIDSEARDEQPAGDADRTKDAPMTSTMETDPMPADAGSHQALLEEASSVLDRLYQQVRHECDDLLRSTNAERERILADARTAAEASAAATRSAADTDAAAIREAANADAAKTGEQATADRDAILETARSEAEVILREARLLAERETAAALAAVDRVRQQLGQLDELKARIEGAAQRLASGEPQPVTSSDSAAQEVDTSVLRSLESELGTEAFADVIDTFLRDIDTQVDRLESALASDDTESAARVLHTLGSSCATVGAHGVAELCRSLTGDSPRDQFEELVARCRIVRDQVAAAGRS